MKSTAIVEKCCMPSLIANKRLVVIRMPPFRIYVFISFVSFLDEIKYTKEGIGQPSIRLTYQSVNLHLCKKEKYFTKFISLLFPDHTIIY